MKMIYNDMWIAIESYNMGLVLSFYDMKDGAKVGSVSLKNRTTTGKRFSQVYCQTVRSTVINITSRS